MNTAAPWYKSQVMVSQIVAAVSAFAALAPKVAAALGLTSPDAINNTVNAVLNFIGLVSAGWAMVARAKSPIAPVTATQKAADAQNTASSPITPGTPK